MISSVHVPVLDAVGRRGALVYEFAREEARTVLTRSSCTSPWHHFPPTYLDDNGCACIWLVNPSGGLVGGDHVTVEARLHAKTHVLMTSPSANRVYRSLSEPAVQEIRLSVGPGARLEWLPEVTIPFAGSKFRQSIHVDLAPGATMVLWDAMASGRIAKDERWAFAGFDNEICIRTSSGSSLVERFRIGSEQAGLRQSIVSQWDYTASAFVVGDRVSVDVWAKMEEAIAVSLEQWPGLVLGGVSEMAAPGLAVKIVARAAPSLAAALETVWGCVRWHLWQMKPIALRRY